MIEVWAVVVGIFSGLLVGVTWERQGGGRQRAAPPPPSATTREVVFGIHDFARLVRGDTWVLSYDDGVRVALRLGDVGGFAGMRALLYGAETRAVGAPSKTEFTAAPTEGE